MELIADLLMRRPNRIRHSGGKILG